MDIFSILFNIPQPESYGLLGEVWNGLLKVFLSDSAISSIGGFYTIIVWFLTFGTLWICFIDPLRRLIRWCFKKKDKKK